MSKFKELFQKMNEQDTQVNTTNDLANFKQSVGMGGGRGQQLRKNLHLHKICGECGHLIKKTSGRYPKKCPNCKAPLCDYDEMNEQKETYKEYFTRILKKYGVKEPDQLKGEDKKKFYDEIDKGWDAGENETD